MYRFFSEKSRSASAREKTASVLFLAAKAQLEHALWEKTKRTILVGRQHPASNSPLKLLPSVSMKQILDFVRTAKKVPAADDATLVVLDDNRTKTSHHSATTRGRDDRPHTKKATTTEEVDLTKDSLYKPGNKIVIPLTKLGFHLTAPCWRDFGRAVRSHPGWNVKRIVPNPKSKKAYFIHAVYTVPSTGTNKKQSLTKKKKDATDESLDSEDKRPVKKTKTVKADA